MRERITDTRHGSENQQGYLFRFHALLYLSSSLSQNNNQVRKIIGVGPDGDRALGVLVSDPTM